MSPPMANPNLETQPPNSSGWSGILKQGGELTSLEVTQDVKVEVCDSTY